MKKFLSAVVAIAAVSAAVPAIAQPYGDRDGYDRGRGESERSYGRGYGSDRGIYAEIQQLDNRVDRSCARRVLSRSECHRLQGQVTWLKSSYRSAMRDGRMNRWERQNLQNSIQRVEYSLRRERRDDDRRDGRRDYDGRGRH